MNIITTIFEILISFILEHEDDEHKLEMCKKILKHFRKLDKDGLNGWEIATKSLKDSVYSIYQQRGYVAFLKVLLLILSKNTPLFMKWCKDIEKAELFKNNEIKKCRRFLFKSFLEFF